jgi:5-formyltetrahydrofolate cyclo-ligase
MRFLNSIDGSTKTDVAAEKTRLRQLHKAQRLAISATQRMQTAEAVAQQLLQLPELLKANYVAAYWASFGELPLHILQMRLQAPQIWCLPIIAPDKTLGFAPWRIGDPLVSNQYGIPEPDLSPSSTLHANDMSIVLMPLLAYTRKGERLGMGGGYYDRSFANRLRTTSPLLIGIAYSSQEVESLPTEDWDVKLDMLVNERELIHFDKS